MAEVAVTTIRIETHAACGMASEGAHVHIRYVEKTDAKLGTSVHSECKVAKQCVALLLGRGAAAGVKGRSTAGQHADQCKDTERDGGGDELAFHLPPLE